jgi:hypothetical protein
MMRFFTPDLYRRFNSPNDEVADRANDDWEAAIKNYQRRLEEIGDRMPSQVKRLAELSLHDAAILSEEEEVQPWRRHVNSPLPSPWWAVAIISVKRGQKALSLIYTLWDHVKKDAAPDDWPFAKEHRHWLYDEVDLVEPGQFLHRILISDGTVMAIPFVSVITHEFPWPAPAPQRPARETA